MTAKALDDVVDVALIEPRDTFVHNVAALRSVTDPEWTEKVFLPYDQLLTRGQLVRDRAVQVDASTVTLSTGERLDADFIVLAMGSSYPFPAKIDVDAETVTRITQRAATHGDGLLRLGILDAQTTSELKGSALMTGDMQEHLGLTAAHTW